MTRMDNKTKVEQRLKYTNLHIPFYEPVRDEEKQKYITKENT